jgi:hypothetical protein
MIKAAITPGIHAQSVRINTITTLPHPLSITAKGGKIMDKITRQILILKNYLRLQNSSKYFIYMTHFLRFRYTHLKSDFVNQRLIY